MKTHLDRIRETWGSVPEYVLAMWGPAAAWDVVGRVLLVHLDSPDPALRARRVGEAEAKALALAGADCPLCREAAEIGGDEVFDEAEAIAAGRDAALARQALDVSGGGR